jgi:Na+/proline symporter
MLAGTFTVLVWIFMPIDSQGNTLSSIIYEIIPGFIASAAVIVIISKLFPEQNDSVDKLFTRFRKEYNTQ